MATATGTQTIQQEITALEADLSQIRAKLADDDEGTLNAIGQERDQLAERIALGQEKPGSASVVARRIEEVERRVAGFRSVIARKQGELDRLYPELRRVAAEERLAKRKGEVEVLAEQGQAAAERINQKILELLTQDFVAFDQIRDRLAEFGDVGGRQAAQEVLVSIGNAGESSVLKHLINKQRWQEGNVWELRSDLILTLRNLWPPKR